ncbi:hypothetical protein RZN22_05220 [Bacillaceae bacterium S4-13-58]
MHIKRMLLIMGFASLAFFGFFWQNNLLSGDHESESSYGALMDIYMENGKAAEIVMTRKDDKDHLLVKYRINFEDYKFESLSAMNIKEPILNIEYKPSTKQVWVEYSDGWKLYDENLEKVIEKIDVRTTYSSYQITVKEQEEKYELSVSGENQDWNTIFEKRPIDVGVIDSHKDLWIILFEDYDVKIWSPTANDI